MQTPNWNSTNEKYNESIASRPMLSLSGIAVFFNLEFTRTKASNINYDHVSTP